ncbi:kinesin [Penicillium longicatenatum]|nr:kinesin [Penicillium longicatenatum]
MYQPWYQYRQFASRCNPGITSTSTTLATPEPHAAMPKFISISSATLLGHVRNDGQQVAINHGQVIFNSYTRTEQPEVPPSSSSTVPFGPDSDFINRGSLLDQVHEKCAAPAGRKALVGVGGVGKSKLAIEYSYQLREKSPEIWVFWIHASNATRFEQSFRGIADRAKIPGRHDPKVNIFRIVHDWLHAEGKWLLIFDNMDDDVEPMDEARALALLQKKLDQTDRNLYRDWDAKNSILITWKLSFDHIRQKRESAADLLSLMSFFDRQGITEDLLQAQSYPDDGYTASEARLHNFSDDSEASDTERDLNAEFEEYISIPSDYSFISVNEEATVLKMHGLVQLAMRNWLDIHGEVEIWKRQFIKNLSRKFPKNLAEMKHLAKVVIKTDEKLLGPEHEDTLQSLEILGVAYEMVGQFRDAEDVFMELLETRKRLLGAEHRNTLHTMTNLANVYFGQGRWQDAEALQVQVLEGRKKVLGAEHPDTLKSMEHLTLIYSDLGQTQDAEVLQAQVLETRKRVLGVDYLGAEHPHTLYTMHNLAFVYFKQGRLQDAKNLIMQVLENTNGMLGAEHPHTLMSMSLLAATYQKDGLWQDIEALQLQVLEIQKRVLDTEHPVTLISMGNLASTYQEHNRLLDAEMLGRQEVGIQKRMLGVEHRNTLTKLEVLSVGKEAFTYCKQGRFEDSEMLFAQALEVQRKVLDEGNSQTLSTMYNLLTIFLGLGRLQDAEALGIEMLGIQQRLHGAEELETLAVMNILVAEYGDECQYLHAEALQAKLIDIEKRVLGVEDPQTLRSMKILGAIYSHLERWEDCEAIYVQVLNIRKSKFGDDHPNTLRIMHDLAKLWNIVDRHADAIELMTNCVNLQTMSLGASHPDTVGTSDTLLGWKFERLAMDGL